MGRSKKTGLDYFPFDIDFFQDLRIRKLIKYQGGKAVTVYALLLCNIYKQGYYMRWDEELPFICSEQTGFEEAYIREVIKCCLIVGLFSKELYESDKVLTSKGIQERYQKICELCRRNGEISEYMVISSEEKAITSEEKPISSAKSTQRKGKKSKVKETTPNGVAKKDAAKAATLSRKDSFYQSLVPYVGKYPKDMIRAFFDYWSELNKSETKMRYELEKTWELPKRLSTWANREKMPTKLTTDIGVVLKDNSPDKYDNDSDKWNR